MSYLAIILVSFLVVFIVIRFAKYSIPLYLILCAGVILGICIAFFNLDLGVKIAAWSAALAACFFFLFAISGIITGMISLFVLGPIALIWSAIKTHTILK